MRKMRTLLAATLATLALASCGGSEPAPTPTTEPANTPKPSATATPTRNAGATAAAWNATWQAGATATVRARPSPTATATPAKTLDDIRAEVLAQFTNAGFLAATNTDTADLARFRDGVLELEYRARFASRDSQPDVSWRIVQLVAAFFGSGSFTPVTTAILASGESFSVRISTYSALGDYRYSSMTTYDQLVAIAGKQMSNAEWVAASGAGFE